MPLFQEKFGKPFQFFNKRLEISLAMVFEISKIKLFEPKSKSDDRLQSWADLSPSALFSFQRPLLNSVRVLVEFVVEIKTLIPSSSFDTVYRDRETERDVENLERYRRKLEIFKI